MCYEGDVCCDRAVCFVADSDDSSDRIRGRVSSHDGCCDGDVCFVADSDDSGDRIRGRVSGHDGF